MANKAAEKKINITPHNHNDVPAERLKSESADYVLDESLNISHPIHMHVHSDDEYKQLQRRISIIIGHTTSIKKMIEDRRDCSEILIQISAVQASINNLGKLILRNHINECLSSVFDIDDPIEHQRQIDYLNNAIDKFIR